MSWPHQYDQDKSEARRQQQKLFQELGPLHRTVINLRAVADDHRKVTTDQASVLYEAIEVLHARIAVIMNQMRTLPSKKNNKAALEKSRNNSQSS